MLGRRGILALVTSVALLMGVGVMMQTVSAVTTVTVTYPNGGEIESGIINITWTTDGDAGDVLALHYSPDNGSTWYTIVYGLSGDNRYYLWDTTTTTPAGAPAPSDGSNYLIRVYYTHNQTSYDTSDNTFTIDNTPPSSSVNPISPYWNTTGSVTITATADDTLSGLKNVSLYYYYSENNETWKGPYLVGTNETPWMGISWNFTFPNGTGYYRFYSIAIDNASNVEEFDGNDTMCGYDTTVPTVTITFPEDGASYNTPISNITGTASDDISGVYAVYVAVINETEAGWNWSAGEWNSTIWWYYPANGTTSWYLNNKTAPSWPEWEDGHTYTVDVWVYDVAGNSVREIHPATFTYDTTPPVSSVNSISPYWNTTGSVTITVTATDATSGVSNVTLWYRFSTDNSSWGNWTYFGKSTDGWRFDFDFPSGEGYYEFYSIANDSAGNTEPAPEGADARCGYDATPPQATITFPEDGAFYNTPISNITGTASDELSGIEDVSICIYNLSDGEIWWWNFTAGKWDNSTPIHYLAEYSDGYWYLDNKTALSWPTWVTGTIYLVDTRVDDNAGNSNTSYVYSMFCYDTTPPTSWIKAIEDYWHGNETIAIRANANDTELYEWEINDLLNLSLYYRYRANNESDWSEWIFYGYGESSASWVFEFTPEKGDGFYQFYTIAIDPAGNVENKTDPDPNGSIGVDTTAPEITLIRPTEGSYYADIDNITGTATDVTSGVDTVYVAIYSYSHGKWWNETGEWGNNKPYLMQATIENNSWYLNQNLPDWENAQKYMVLVLAIDVAGNEKFITANFTILSLHLYEGWNLVSVPRELENPSIEAVFEGITTITRVYYYDPISGWKWAFYDNETESWDTSGGLTTIDDGKGYWIYATAETNVPLTLKDIEPPYMPPTYQIKAGWNMIGYTSINLQPTMNVTTYLSSLNSWTVIYKYDTSSGTFYMAKPGYYQFNDVALTEGYWLYSEVDDELVP